MAIDHERLPGHSSTAPARPRRSQPVAWPAVAENPAHAVQLSTGLGETVLPPEDPDALAALAAALAEPAARQRDAVSAVVARWPRFLDAWSRLGQLARDDIEAYAAFRVGYHRGLDRLRQNGWRGSGYVRWTHETNRGFLRALDGLARQAAAIGEADEAERCQVFLRQCDPTWPPPESTSA